MFDTKIDDFRPYYTVVYNVIKSTHELQWYLKLNSCNNPAMFRKYFKIVSDSLACL